MQLFTKPDTARTHFLHRAKNIGALLAFLCGTQLAFTTPAEASGVMLVSSDMLALFQIASSPNFCVAYSYDRNGNLLVKTNGTYGQAVWGSASFGCFSWTSS